MSTIILIEPGGDGDTNQWQRELEDFDQYLLEHDLTLEADDVTIGQQAQNFFDVHLDGVVHVNRTPMGDIIVSKEYKYATETGL